MKVEAKIIARNYHRASSLSQQLLIVHIFHLLIFYSHTNTIEKIQIIFSQQAEEVPLKNSYF